MLRTLLLISVLTLSGLAGNDPQTPYEKSGFKATATYDEAIAFYKELETSSSLIKVKEYGQTDAGKPLHLVVLSGNGEFNPRILKKMDQRVLLVNNAIHPGEPCGVDASMMLARDLITDKAMRPFLDHTVVLIIPLYNIGGALNRGCCSRVNQVGPEAYGFRGNARNLDLNRDFIKANSRNAKAFTAIFQEWMPDVFIDNHTTNGADYPYVMTLIPTQRDKFNPELADYMIDQMMPFLYENMAAAEYEMCPYVNSVAAVPDSGIADFLETPRYSTGYTSLYNCISFTTEAHMLKTFEQRVEACYMFMQNMIKVINKDRVTISRLKKKADQDLQKQEEFAVKWKMNRDKFDMINFKGYEAKYKKSEITGMDRLYYDRNSPWKKEIKFFHYFEPEVSVQKPRAYLIPQAWGEVIERLQLNGVELERLTEDAELEVEMYTIEDYESTDFPYEGHYLHYNIKTKKEPKTLTFHQGDYAVFTDQVANRYIIETLEPEAHDSYLCWNFFDEILFQKEYFSSYVFEETAAEILAERPELKEELEAAKFADSTLANSARAQLDFIYKRSKYHEDSHRRYPVGRWMGKGKLPVK